MVNKWILRKVSWPRFLFKSVITIGVIYAAGVWFAANYRIGYDHQYYKCIPGYTFYLIDLKDQALKKGSIYAFKARNMQPFFENGTQMVKILRALPGDTVEVNKGDHEYLVRVNGEVVGKGLYLSNKLGVPESSFAGKTILETGNYWFMGTSPLSFDSRYWGSVKNDQIIGRAYPIF